jgi:hypothetical protein
MFGNIECIADTTDTVSFRHQKNNSPKISSNCQASVSARNKTRNWYNFNPQLMVKQTPKIGNKLYYLSGKKKEYNYTP